MRISVVTPTCDRQIGIELLERYMAAQTLQPDEWIVADGGSVPAKLTMGQQHYHDMAPSGPRNLAGNMLRGLRRATGDFIIIFEDDDYYFPDHIEESIRAMQQSPVSGCPTLAYYNVQKRWWIKMQNKGSALCQTGFRRSHLNLMLGAAQEAFNSGSYAIDQVFWQRSGAQATMPQTVIGIKGLPGTKGLGIGHRPGEERGKRKREWVSDPDFQKLKEWLGPELAEPYTRLEFPA